jgi:hypothetical protein
MSSRDQSENPEDVRDRAQLLWVRIPLAGLAVALSLLAGMVAGFVASRSAATGGKAPTAAPPTAAAANDQPAVSNRPTVRRVDPHVINGNMEVIITLDQPTPYEAHRLGHPDRIYIDLHDAGLLPELAGKTIAVNNGGVSNIRLPQTQPGTVRVVVDLEQRFNYAVTPQTNPATLVLKLTPPARQRREPKKISPQDY